MGLSDLFKNDVAVYVGSDFIQLGTSHESMTTVPAYVATHIGTGKVLAVGEDAQKMVEKEPNNISVTKTFKLGMPWDFDLTETLFRYCFKKYLPKRIIPPRVVLSGQINTDITKRSFKEALTHAGARDVMLLESPMAAAIGLGLKVEQPELRILLHFERDWFYFTIISLAGVLASEFAPIGSDSFYQDITIYTKETLGFDPDQKSLDSQIQSIGFESTLDLIGWESWIASIETGKETTHGINPELITKASTPTFLRIRESYSNCLNQIEKSKRLQLSAAPIHLTGSFSKTLGFAKILSKHLGNTVLTYNNSERAAYDGTVKVLAELNDLIPYVTAKKKASSEEFVGWFLFR